MGLFRRRPPSDPSAPGPGVETFAELRELIRIGAGVDAQRASIAAALVSGGVPEGVAERFVGAMRDGVALFEVPAPGDEAPCRLGGRPLLPAGEPWPTDRDGAPLTFVAALDLAAVPPVAPLPAAGTLLVFWNLAFAEQDATDFVTATRLFLVPPGEPLADAPAPAGAHAFGPVALDPVAMPFPGDRAALTSGEVPDGVPGELLGDLLLEEYSHGLLGVSRDIQGPVLDEVPYWFGQGAPETRERYSPAELAGEGWALLAQIDETRGLQLGDVGSLYLVVPAADLEAGRVDRAMGIMQC